MSKQVTDGNGNIWKDKEGNLWEDALEFHFWEGIKYKFPLCCIINFCDFFLKNNFFDGWISNEDFQKIDFEIKWVEFFQCVPCIEKSLRRRLE